MSPKRRPNHSGNRNAVPRREGAGRARLSRPSAAIFLRLVQYVKPHKGKIALVAVAVLMTSAAELAPPWFIRWGIDWAVAGGRNQRIVLIAAGLVGLSLIQGAIDFLRLALMAFSGEKIVFEIRNALFEHLTRLSFSFYDRARTGDLMSRVTSDVAELTQFFGRAAGIVLTNFFTLIGILIVASLWDWRLALLYLLLLPAVALGMAAYARRVQPAMVSVRRTMGNLTSVLQQTLAGIVVVKLFGREAFEQKKVDKQNIALLEANIKTTRISALWMPYANVLAGAAAGLVLWGAGESVIRGYMSIGTLIGFSAYMAMLVRPIRQTGMMLNVFMRALAAAERVFEVLDIEPEIHDSPNAYPLKGGEGRIRFDGVSFSYEGGNEVLHGVDLEIKPEEVTAIVGPSGAGKTTLVHLLLRFYDPQKGTIYIDGHDIRGVTVASLRQNIGIGMQSAFLFDASIGENIAYGNPHATQAQIEWAAGLVRLHDFVVSLPMGYGTPVGERGVRLSGGQKQRVALARVLLTDPGILILDEPTSSVDAHTEGEMQQALREVWCGRTTIIIAHRLWTVSQADHIVLVQDGRIAEQARGAAGRSAHEILMADSGFYRELYSLQFYGETLAGGEEKRL